VHDDFERDLAAAREQVDQLTRRLGADTRDELVAALERQWAAERKLAAGLGEQYAQVIDIGPQWNTGAPLPHLVSNRSRVLLACLASRPDPDWDGTSVTVASPDDENPSPFAVIELWGCAELRFGGPTDDALRRHPLHGRGLVGHRVHEVINSRWIEEAIRVSAEHPSHADGPLRHLHHYLLPFHDEMLEALALGIESRLVRGTLREIMADLTAALINEPYRAV